MSIDLEKMAVQWLEENGHKYELNMDYIIGIMTDFTRFVQKASEEREAEICPCGRPRLDELHQADAKLLVYSTHTRDDYHKFGEPAATEDL